MVLSQYLSFLFNVAFVSIVAARIFSFVFGAACAACFIVTLMPKFDTAEYVKVRGIMFIILGLSTLSLFFMFGQINEMYVTPWSILTYAVGGYIYI